jgi:hypothetical protein
MYFLILCTWGFPQGFPSTQWIVVLECMRFPGWLSLKCMILPFKYIGYLYFLRNVNAFLKHVLLQKRCCLDVYEIAWRNSLEIKVGFLWNTSGSLYLFLKCRGITQGCSLQTNPLEIYRDSLMDFLWNA